MDFRYKMSVVVPTHGRVDLFRETFECLLNQTVSNFEIIITDDSSEEVDRTSIKNLVNAQNSSRIKYIHTRPNLLQAPNTNQGLKIASGEYIRILHSDDLICPKCIEKEIEYFDDHPEIDMFYHHALFFTDKCYFSKDELEINIINVKESWLNRSIFIMTMLPSAIVFRHSLLDKVGLMNENYKFLCDWDLFFKFLLNAFVNNKNIGYVDAGYVGWRNHNNSVSGKLCIEHFYEHQDFIKRISKLYIAQEILTRSEVEENIFLALNYRTSRIFDDYLYRLPLKEKIQKMPAILWIIISNLNIWLHSLLQIIFMPFSIIYRIIAFILKLKKLIYKSLIKVDIKYQMRCKK